MKKLILVFVLGLLWSGNVFSSNEKYGLFGVVLGDNVNNYNPKFNVIEYKVIIDPPIPNENFILYYATINKKTNAIVSIGGISKKNYPIGNENLEKEKLEEKLQTISKKCRMDHKVFVELISQGAQFKNLNNNLKEFYKRSRLYIFEGNEINFGEDGNIKFIITNYCRRGYGAFIKGKPSGARALIDLMDNRVLRQTIRDNKDFDNQKLDKSGIQ